MSVQFFVSRFFVAVAWLFFSLSLLFSRCVLFLIFFKYNVFVSYFHPLFSYSRCVCVSLWMFSITEKKWEEKIKFSFVCCSLTHSVRWNFVLEIFLFSTDAWMIFFSSFNTAHFFLLWIFPLTSIFLDTLEEVHTLFRLFGTCVDFLFGLGPVVTPLSTLFFSFVLKQYAQNSLCGHFYSILFFIWNYDFFFYFFFEGKKMVNLNPKLVRFLGGEEYCVGGAFVISIAFVHTATSHRFHIFDERHISH